MNSFHIAEMTKSFMEYDMIQQNTDLPEFPEFRARLLFALLLRNDHQKQYSELYTVATSLIQIGLDTHDRVPFSNNLKEKKATRSRQLKVLAGDYFSSRFYQLLSQAGQIEMIKQLSNAICEVNRLKINLYLLMKQFKLTAEEYIQQSVNIKVQLFLSFTKLLDGITLRCWPDILKGYTQCEVITEEIYRSETLHNFEDSWAFWHLLQFATREEKKQLVAVERDNIMMHQLIMKYNISSQLYNMLELQIQQVGDKIRQLDSEKLIHDLFQIGEPFTKYLSRQKVIDEV